VADEIEKPQPSGFLKQDAKKYGKLILFFVVALYLINLIVCVFAALLGKNIVLPSGAFWLGAVIGVLVGLYVQEAKEWDQALAASVADIAVLLLCFLALIILNEMWFYLMGLMGGSIVGTVWHSADPPE
jgi:uncharacterized membrane protein